MIMSEDNSTVYVTECGCEKLFKNKTSKLIDKFIDVLQQCDDSFIIDYLADIFSYEELKYLGFGNYVKNYFEDEEEENNNGERKSIAK